MATWCTTTKYIIYDDIYCHRIMYTNTHACPSGEWLEHLIPVPGAIGSNPAVSGVISGKLTLAAGFIQSTLWRGLAQCFDLDSFGQII